jgi:hypothetical protein
MTAMGHDPRRVGSTRRASFFGAAFLSVTLSFPTLAAADEGGVSFWLPGLFGSLAAAPATPGWAFSAFYYHTSVEGGGGRTFKRGGNIVVGIEGKGDLVGFGPTYVFQTPVLGAQAAVSLLGVTGRNHASVEATLTGPFGNTISGERSQSIWGFGDVIAQGTLKWNFGVHNLMTYAMGNVPVGAYDANRIVNLGLGHNALDWGVGYTYFDQQSGLEFSGVTGFTYNFENNDTQYKNGVDWHFDWGVSQFLSKQIHVGLVGYFYHQLTGDSGAGATLGPFKSQVAGLGPQIGWLFPVADDMQGYLSVKGYKEFAAENRPDGWNVWLSFALSPRAPEQAAPPPVLTRKY